MPEQAPEQLQLHEILKTGLAELSLGAPKESIEQLAALAELVADWGSRINLTGHRTREAVARRLILDAAALWAALDAESDTLVDLGSGAGFPGLPVAILEPAVEVVLVEARERRHHFQRHVVRELGLPNVRPIRARHEEVDPTPSGAVIAQAVGPPQELLPIMLRWAVPGAVLAVPGGTIPRSTASNDALQSVEMLSYQVPLKGPVRTLWVGRVF